MPKVVVPKQLFPELDIYTQKVEVRYRIISDDKNNASYWSPIFLVDPDITFVQGTLDMSGTIYLQKNNNYVSVVWDSVAIYKNPATNDSLIAELPSYDIWVRWAGNGGVNPSDWIYKERISSTSVDIIVPASYDYPGGSGTPRQLTVEVYRPGRPVVQDSASDFLMYTGIITTL
jgi:hypothetical protein